MSKQPDSRGNESVDAVPIIINKAFFCYSALFIAIQFLCVARIPVIINFLIESRVRYRHRRERVLLTNSILFRIIVKRFR